MKLLKSRFFLIAILPNLFFVAILIFQIYQSVGASPGSPLISFIEINAQVFSTFTFIRQIYLWLYLLGAGLLTYEYIKARKKNRKVFIRSLVIVLTGALISQFALFLAFLSYDLFSRI